MERENQRIAITKRLLKESLLRLLEEKELDKINITELCREAGINRATFYRHYSLPKDVLIDIEKDLYHDLRSSVMAPTSVEELKPCIEKLCAHMEQNADLLRIIMRCNSDADFAQFVSELFFEVYAEFMKSSLFRDLEAEEVKVVALYTAGGTYFTLRHWLMGDVQKSSHPLAELLYKLIDKTDPKFLSLQLAHKKGK